MVIVIDREIQQRYSDFQCAQHWLPHLLLFVCSTVYHYHHKSVLRGGDQTHDLPGRNAQVCYQTAPHVTFKVVEDFTNVPIQKSQEPLAMESNQP